MRAWVRAHVNVFKTVLAEMENLNQEVSLKIVAWMIKLYYISAFF